MTPKGAPLVALTLIVGSATGEVAHAYKRSAEVVDGRQVSLRWNSPTVRYFVNSRTVPGVTTAQLQAVMGRAYDEWQNVPTASISFEFGGVTSTEPLEMDGMNTVGFLAARELEGVLALNLSIFDVVTGEMVESDTIFNSSEAWSVVEAGERDRYDLESTAVHENGHFLGLDHSALGVFAERDGDLRLAGAEAVMFPFAFDPGSIALRSLKADDIAGVSLIYSDGDFRSDTGALEGRVVRGEAGVFGAHVVALNPLTGQLVAGFALSSSGAFRIDGLAPGRYIVRVEPIDDIGADRFFTDVGGIDVNFAPVFFDRFVGVPAGGVSNSFDIQVRAR